MYKIQKWHKIIKNSKNFLEFFEGYIILQQLCNIHERLLSHEFFGMKVYECGF